MMRYFWTGLTILLTGCGSDGPELRTLITQPEVTQTQINRDGYAIFRSLDLPDYLESDALITTSPLGGISDLAGWSWGDAPDRAFIQALSGHISTHSGMLTIAEPAPTSIIPKVFIDVIVTSFAPQPNNILQLRGQYFITDYDTGQLLHAVPFSINEPNRNIGAHAARPYEEALHALAHLIANDI